MSPRTKTVEVGTVGGDVAQALARLKDLDLGMEGEQQQMNYDEGNGDEESDEDCINLDCFRVKLGLRGGDAGVVRSRYIEFDEDDDDEGFSQATLAWIRGDHMHDYGNEKKDDRSISGSENRDLDDGKMRPRVLKRMDPATNLRALGKRYDPDEESAYSRSTGGRSIPHVLINDTGEMNQVKEQPVRLSKYRQHRLDMKWQAHDCQKGGEEHRCLRASHAWRKRAH